MSAWRATEKMGTEKTNPKDNLSAAAQPAAPGSPAPQPSPDPNKAKLAAGWVHRPCIIHLLALAEDRLTELTKVMGIRLVQGQVAKVHTHFPLDDLMVIYPANPKDLSATEIKRSGSSATINVSDKAIMAGVAVETGYKELRPIVLIPEDSELWPGLAIDFSLAPLQRKLAVKEKEEGEEGTAITNDQ